MFEVGPYVVVDVLPEVADRGMSGGAFGSLYLAIDPTSKQEVVVKCCRSSGGSRSNTVGVGFHHPDVAFRAGGLGRNQHVTLGVEDVADVLRHEAVLLEQSGGIVLPGYLGLFEAPFLIAAIPPRS